jgi:hypothetical protein
VLTSWVEFEHRFRIAGVKYHKIPHFSRHSLTLPNGPRIEQRTIDRLAQVLETDRSRYDQNFFAPWMDVYNGATEVLDNINACNVASKTIEQLRTLENKCAVALSKLFKPTRNLEAGLSWLEESVERLAERSDEDASKNLLVKHSREGSLFRRWIQTFLEIEHGLVWNNSEYTENCVDKGFAVEEGLYWSSFVDGSEQNADSMEGD